MTTNQVLCEGFAKGSNLEKAFGPEGFENLNRIGDQIFVDRDGKIFEFLINYLRNNC